MNTNIQYDNYYKFLVSLGTVLIVAPFIGLKFILFDVPGILISASTYSNLSEISLEIFNTKMSCLKCAYCIAPVICITSVIIGFILLIRRCINWKQAKTIKDEDELIDHKLKQQNFEKQSVSEVIENKIEKILDSQSELNNQDNETLTPTASDSELTSKTSFKRRSQSTHEVATTYIKLEEKVHKYVKKSLGEGYVVEFDVRRGNSLYDLVAVSDNQTIYYEIKYWSGYYLPPAFFAKLMRCTEQYQIILVIMRSNLLLWLQMIETHRR